MNLDHLEKLYRSYNKRDFVHPDPLEFLYRYQTKADIEIAGLIASSLAYGRVNQILKSVSQVLTVMDEPEKYIHKANRKQIRHDFRGFRHRFTNDEDLIGLITSIQTTICKHGSLNGAFAKGYDKNERNMEQSLVEFINFLGGPIHSLLPDPSKSSACKRLHLFLRWMVRKDEVDLGIWSDIDPGKLVVPLDTHMMAFAKTHKLTKRKHGDHLASLEITEKFRILVPDDPVKFDFVLTRFGIHPQLSKQVL